MAPTAWLDVVSLAVWVAHVGIRAPRQASRQADLPLGRMAVLTSLHVARLASWPALGLGFRNFKLGRHYTLGNAPVDTVRRPRVAVPLLPLCLSGITCISQPAGCIGTRLRFDTCLYLYCRAREILLVIRASINTTWPHCLTLCRM